MSNTVGIMLTTMNQLELTKKAIKSLIQNTSYPYELVIVDNNSNDGTQEWVKEQGFEIIEFKENTSLTEALNAGIRFFLNKENEFKAYDIAWIHNDMEFYPNWLTALVKYLEEHPECGRVSSHNMRDPLAPERSGNELPFLIRGHIFKTIGMFDEKFIGIGGREDWDLNNRIIQDNFTVMITPESRVLHKGMGTRSLRNTDAEANFNASVYYNKWGTYDAKV